MEEIKNNKTGYPHIDKPWMKYYKKFDKIESSYKTVYQEVHDNNVGRPHKTALEFFGTNIDFDKMDKLIDLTAKSLKEYGVKKGDFVTIISAGIPETVYVFYALSKIGAVANMMAPYFDQNGMIARINECESKLVLVMDTFYDQVKDALSKSNIKNIIIIPTLNSTILKYITKKVKVENENELLWKQFIKDGKYQSNVDIATYEKDMPLAMVYSSGTTGASKGILLSNDSFQNSIYSYKYSGVEIGSGYKFYQIIPPWYSTGLSTSIHLPLSNGSMVFMDPRFERDVFIKNIVKHKPNYAVAPTSMYEGFLEANLVKNHDLSFFKYPFEGGEPLRKEVSDKIEQVFSEHGSNAKLLVGYGQCECGATITSETSLTNHVNGNVGIPLPGINLCIVDDNRNKLKYNERGEILVDTPCGMLEYFHNKNATNEYFYLDNNVKWYCTGDIGSIDECGNLYIYGRASDYSIVNGKKIYNFDIENAILKDSNVKLCDVLTQNDNLTIHIVFNKDFDYENSDELLMNELKKIQELIYNELGDEDFVPCTFKIRESFPYAKSGKRDILSMLKEKDGFFKIDKFNPDQKKLSI